MNRHYPGQYLKPGEFLSPDSWICTMVMAASLTLPLALKDVGTVLKTSQQKDKEGETPHLFQPSSQKSINRYSLLKM